MDIGPFKAGRVLDATEGPFPSRLHCLENCDRDFAAGSHYYGFVLRGRAAITRAGLEAIAIGEKMHFSSPAPFHLACEGQVVLWERLGYHGLFEMGGPVEEVGRLLYIDGCTTTILCPPPKVLDPVLNLLCFPAHTKQTMHYHPTARLGVIFDGHGECVQPGMAPIALLPGMVFRIRENQPHCFHTGEEPMRLIAFHPDSDTGPTDENHPMLNRTYRLP